MRRLSPAGAVYCALFRPLTDMVHNFLWVRLLWLAFFPRLAGTQHPCKLVWSESEAIAGVDTASSTRAPCVAPEMWAYFYWPRARK